MKPLNNGHLQVLKKLSVTERCLLLGGNLKRIVTFGNQPTFCPLFMACQLFGMSASGRFHCTNKNQPDAIQETANNYKLFSQEGL